MKEFRCSGPRYRAPCRHCRIRPESRGRSLAADSRAHTRASCRCRRDNLLHRLAHVSGGILGNDPTDHPRSQALIGTEPFPPSNFRQHTAFQLAVVHDRADHVQHLNRRYREALTERCGRQCDFVPVTGQHPAVWNWPLPSPGRSMPVGSVRPERLVKL